MCKIWRECGGRFTWCMELQDHNGLILQALKSCFKISIDNKWNVLPTMESHEGIWFVPVYPHCFIVHTIFQMLVPGRFAVESLEAVQEEVLLAVILTVATSE